MWNGDIMFIGPIIVLGVFFYIAIFMLMANFVHRDAIQRNARSPDSLGSYYTAF